MIMEKEIVTKQLIATYINNKLHKDLITAADIHWKKPDASGANWYIEPKNKDLDETLQPVLTHVDDIKTKFRIKDEG